MDEHGKRATGGRTAGEQGGERRGEARPRRRTSPSRLIPGTFLGYALAVLSALILGVGAFAASGLVREIVGQGLPGPGAPDPSQGTNLAQSDGGLAGAHSLFLSEVPGGEGAGFGQEVAQSQTAAGARVTLGWAYADAGSVAVAYTVEDLTGGRRVGANPAELQPGYPNRVLLTDESGTEYRFADGGGEVSEGPNNILERPRPNSAVFEPMGRIEPGGWRRFHLEITLFEVPLTRPGEEAPEAQPVGDPFVFDFKVPVRPAPVVEVNQKATASGLTLALKRVTGSPGRPEAVVCLEPTDGVRGMFPIGGDLSSETSGPVAGEGDCMEMLLKDPLDGPSSVAVEQIELNPGGEGELIRGPWRFDFEVPGP